MKDFDRYVWAMILIVGGLGISGVWTIDPWVGWVWMAIGAVQIGVVIGYRIMATGHRA